MIYRIQEIIPDILQANGQRYLQVYVPDCESVSVNDYANECGNANTSIDVAAELQNVFSIESGHCGRFLPPSIMLRVRVIAGW